MSKITYNINKGENTMASVYDRVWEYKTFSELTPEAAREAIKNNELFTQNTLWGRSMNPNRIDRLFHSNGSPTKLTIKEREQYFSSI